MHTFGPLRLQQLYSLDDLTLGGDYIQSAWAKTGDAFPDHGERAQEVARIMAAPVDCSILSRDTSGYKDERDYFKALHWVPWDNTNTALQFYTPQVIAEQGLKVRRALPCPVTAKFKPQVSALTAQVAALKGELAEAKDDDSKLRAHLRDAHDEAAGLQRRCNRLQEQLDDCDCEE